MQRPVNLKIEQDWNKLRQVFNRLNERRLLGLLEFNKIEHQDMGMTQYYLGEYGSIGVDNNTAVGKSTYGSGWIDFSGQLLYALLPWSKQAHRLFEKINLVSICWITTSSPVNLHRDYKNFTDPNKPYYVPSTNTKGKQCKINYIVSSLDPLAETISYDHVDPTQQWSTKSIPGTAFLLDTDYPHEVRNTQYREILQFLFDEDYDTISNYLDLIGPIYFK